MTKRGDPVLHIYILFIVSCLVYGGWTLKKYVNDLEDTVELQLKAIEAQQKENNVLKEYIRVYTPMRPPIVPQSINQQQPSVLH